MAGSATFTTDESTKTTTEPRMHATRTRRFRRSTVEPSQVRPASRPARGAARAGEDSGDLQRPLHPRVHGADEVQRRPRRSGDLDRDRPVLCPLDRDAVPDRVEARLSLVDDPVRDVVRRPGRCVRVLEVPGSELLTRGAVVELPRG